MNREAFFEAVLPWGEPGWCSIHGLVYGGMPGTNYERLSEFLFQLARLQDGVDWYFALGRHSGNRDRVSVTHLMALFADIDVGKPGGYASKEEAIAGLLAFCQRVGIPPPSAIVDSGGGIHAYWFSDRPLKINIWQRYADGLKKTFAQHGFPADPAVTADAARVLRIPGTQNFKEAEPRPVAIIPAHSPGTRYDIETMFARLCEPRGPDIAPSLRHLPLVDLAEGIKHREIPLEFKTVLNGCGWLRHVHDTHGQDQPEPLWREALRCCSFFDDGQTLAHTMGSNHPDYAEVDTDEKYQQALKSKEKYGWPQCQQIHSLHGDTDLDNPCDTCPHFGKIKSPLNLGMQDAKPKAQPKGKEANEEIEADDEELKFAAEKAELELPPPEWHMPRQCYVHKETRQIHVYVKTAKIGVFVRLFKNYIHTPGLQWHHVQYWFGCTVNTEMQRQVEVSCSVGDILGGTAIRKLGEQLLLVETNKLAEAKFKDVMVSWIDNLRAIREAVRDPGTLGWRFEDGTRTGFAYGGQLYTTDGGSITIPAVGDDDFRRHYVPVGKAEPWHKAVRLITDRRRPELEAVVAVGFAAPLMPFTGNLYGGILSVYGEAGSAKSCAQQVAAAIWGHPKQTRESLGSTPKSVQGRLGRIRNLPAYWDDIQSVTNQEHLCNTMFVATQGAEGGRLTPNADYRERKDWQTMLVACSNMSFVDYMLNIQHYNSAAVRRVLEIEFKPRKGEPGMIDAHDANKIFAELEYNYGRIGEQYVKQLVQNHKAVDKLVTNTIRRFVTRVEGKPEENYWWAMCGVLISGAQLAKEYVGASLDPQRLEDYLVQAFLENRGVRQKEIIETGSLRSNEETIIDFINNFVATDQALYTDVMARHKAGKIDVRHPPKPGLPVVLQLAVDERKIIIAKVSLREYLTEAKLPTRQVINGVMKTFNGRELKYTLGAGTSYSHIQQTCIELPVPSGSLFESILFRYGSQPVAQLLPAAE